MKVEQKSYAQIVIPEPSDFIFRLTYMEIESKCPFMVLPGLFAADFRTAFKESEKLEINKPIIILLADYWAKLAPEEKKAVLDHELGHITNGDLKKIEDQYNRTGTVPQNNVNEEEEMAADAYSAKLNGSNAIYTGLIKALDVMAEGYRKKGYQVTPAAIINQTPIIKNRLELLEKQSKEKASA